MNDFKDGADETKFTKKREGMKNVIKKKRKENAAT